MATRFMNNNQSANCCYTCAAATSSARISRILDTATVLVVSIFVFLVNLRLGGLLT